MVRDFVTALLSPLTASRRKHVQDMARGAAMQIESRSRTIVLQALQDREWRFLLHVRFVVEFGAGLAARAKELAAG